ncbi:DNA pilot protein [Chicken microvirus mg7_8]|nr:DNA pilot protein [Chicken microvirus mg7_8]
MIMDWKAIGQTAAQTGIGAITGGVGGALASGLSGLIGNIFGDKTPSQKDIMEWQEKMLEKQFAFNKQEAALNRDFQKSMMEAAQQWNSIGSQMQRAQAAGVNPFSLINNSGYQSVGSSAMASGSQAAPASGMMPGQPSSLDAQRFNLIAAAMQSISNSSLSQSKKNEIDTKLAAELRKTIAEADINEAEAKIKQLVANDPRLSDFVTAFFVKAREEAETAAARTDYIKDMSDLVKQDKNLKFLQGKIKKDHWEIVQPLLGDYYQGVIDKNTAETGLAKARTTTESYVQAELWSRKQLNDITAQVQDTIKQLNDFVIDINKATNDDKKAFVKKHYQELRNRESELTDLLREQLELAKKNNDTYMVRVITDCLTDLISVGADVYAKTRKNRGYIEESETSHYGRDTYSTRRITPI